MKLNKLSPGKKARKQRKRVGRGNASGSGRTAGRGEKGQKARSGGGVRVGFEGGQMPLYRRLPKIGFRSRKQMLGENQYQIVNLDVLENLENGTEVSPEFLKKIGYSQGSKQKAGIKILGRGELTKKLVVKAHAVSRAARAKIEEKGGSVEILN